MLAPNRYALFPHITLFGTDTARAPQLFLGTLDKVYIVDKVENNPTQIDGHPAWAAGRYMRVSDILDG